MNQNNIITNRIKQFQNSDNQKSFWIFWITISTIFLSVSASIISLTVYPILNVLFLIITFIFFCRLFVIEHDCGHCAFFRTPFQNRLAGHIAGFLIFLPFSLWEHIHNLHHNSMGNLNKRNINPELWTMTTEEYLNSNFMKRLGYRILRSVILHIFIMPFALFIISKIPITKLHPKAFISVLITDMIYVLIFFLLIKSNLLISALIIYFLPLYLFSVFASLIFHLQHQFEDTYWKPEEEWNHVDASLKGSSFIEFGPVFKWITGNVGFHHIHHLNSKIPFYNLSDASKELSSIIEVKSIKFSSVFYQYKHKLWDPKQNKLRQIS